ncbi:MAG: hypothetical protein DRG80_04920, partial [Deltaproteobacteria bacterium]
MTSLDCVKSAVRRATARSKAGDCPATDLFTLTCRLLKCGKQAEVDRVFNALYQQNTRGIELEQAGRVDEAIKFYERSVADWFGGNHPYDRLRIIYTRREQY